jgi:hypothetical protein
VNRPSGRVGDFQCRLNTPPTPIAGGVQGPSPQFAKRVLRSQVDADTVYKRTLYLALSSLWEGARAERASPRHSALPSARPLPKGAGIAAMPRVKLRSACLPATKFGRGYSLSIVYHLPIARFR